MEPTEPIIVDRAGARAAIERLGAALAGDPSAAAHVGVLEGVLGALDRYEARLRAYAASEERLRSHHTTLMKLARSESIGRGALDEALREMTEATTASLDVARSSVWLYDADHTSIQCVELYVRSERAHESGVQLFAKDFPSYFEALREERTIAAHDAHTDPRTACFSEGYLTPLGINSMLDAPIRVGGRMIGVVCNEHVGPQRVWTTEDEQFAASIADFVALAIESARRKETEDQLRAMVEALEGEGT